uniref:Mitochondrial assembly of ribosomal large subunit protein 1 n=1 Tax=Sinocyclocheilus grahami TaxID=75366 RepID=A0A672LVM9_SINGR
AECVQQHTDRDAEALSSSSALQQRASSRRRVSRHRGHSSTLRYIIVLVFKHTSSFSSHYFNAIIIWFKDDLIDSWVQEFDVALLVSVLKQENASDVCVIRVPPELKYTDHMIIVSGSSPRHLSAIAELLLKTFKFLRKDKEPHVRLEGRDCDDWKCIDFGPMVLHLMLPDTRQMYELEKLWTLRSYDEQLKRIPPETLPSDFIYDIKPT